MYPDHTNIVPNHSFQFVILDSGVWLSVLTRRCGPHPRVPDTVSISNPDQDLQQDNQTTSTSDNSLRYS